MYQPNQPSNQTIDWTVLPAELQKLIFSDMQLRSLAVLRLVCKRWCSATANLPCSFKGFHNRTLTSEKLCKIMNLFPNCYHVNLSSTTKLVSNDLLCLSGLKALRQIHLDANISGNPLEVLVSLNNITRTLHVLSLSGTTSVLSVPKPCVVTLSTLTSFQNLQRLILRYSDFSEALSAASSLRFLTSLEVFGMTYKEGGLLATYLPHFGNLRMLKICDTKLKLTPADSDAICCLPSLTNLVMEIYDDDEDYSTRVEKKVVLISSPSAEAVKALTNLEELHVPSAFTSPQVISDLGYLKRLTRLNITAVGAGRLFTTDELRSLAQKAPLLRVMMVPLPRMSDNVLEALSCFPSLLRITATTHDNSITDAGIAHLTRMRLLESLSLSTSGLTDTSAYYVAQLRRLTFLSALHAPWSADAMRHLSSLHSLRLLLLSNSMLSDYALEPIVRSNRDIFRLSASNCHLGSATYLSCLHSLRFLDVSSNKKFDDAAVAVLSSSLDNLNIAGTSVTGVGFANAACRSLRVVTFVQYFVENSMCPFTEEGAAAVARLTNIKNLNIGMRVFPDEIVRALLSGACKYETISVKGLTAAQAPLLLKQTALRSLHIDDPVGLSEQTYETIRTTIRPLQQFQVRENGSLKWTMPQT